MTHTRDEIIGTICDIWSDLLAVDVGPEDTFFDLGGYSLLVVNMVADARNRGLDLRERFIYTGTPASIADALLAGQPADTAAEAGGTEGSHGLG